MHVVSAAPAIIGDSGEMHWQGKYVTDDFGRIQYHDVIVPAEFDEDGNVVVEEHTETQPVLNPEWTAEQEYIPRKDRSEWAAVGVLGWLANRIKAITGQNSCQASPPVSLTECSNHISSGTHQNATINSNGFMSYSDKQKLDNATNDYTASKLMMRDSSGRAKVKTPSSDYDITNKTYVDSNFVKKNADTTILLIVAVAAQLDLLISIDSMALRTVAVSYYIANEGFSILENRGAMGLPLPTALKMCTC